MSTQTVRYLIVIRTSSHEERELDNSIRHCQEMIERVKHIKSIQPEWHLLYVAPHVPAFALFSPEMVHFAQNEWKKGITAIQAIGEQLNIPESQQHLESGHPDLQAIRVAHAIDATYVIGYSQAFQKYVQFRNKINNFFFTIKKEMKRTFGAAAFRELNHRLHHH